MITIFIEISATTVSIICFKRYQRKHNILLNKKAKKSNTSNGRSISNTNYGQSISNISCVTNISNQTGTQSLTKLSIQFTIFSSISNTFILLYNLFLLFIGEKNYVIYHIFLFGASLTTLFKLGLNFFLFYFYNRQFRKTFGEIFCFKNSDQ